MGLISGFRVECLSPSPSPSPPLAFGGIDLISRFRHHHRRRWSCCSRRGVDFGWVVWIVLLGLFQFRVSGLCGLCCWVMLILSASILLLGLFFWFSAGGLCGLCCWVCFDSGFLDCVDCVAGLCWFRVRQSFCWVCFSSFLPMGCVDSDVIPVWVGGCGSVVVWVKKWIFYLNKRVE